MDFKVFSIRTFGSEEAFRFEEIPKLGGKEVSIIVVPRVAVRQEQTYHHPEPPYIHFITPRQAQYDLWCSIQIGHNQSFI